MMAAGKGFILSESDQRVLRELVQWWKTRQVDLKRGGEPELPPNTDVYIAWTGASGIPALSRGDNTGTSTAVGDLEDDVPGSATLGIYRISRLGGTTHMRPIQGLRKKVWNIATVPVPPWTWVVIKKDKPGFWLAEVQAVEPPQTTPGDTTFEDAVEICGPLQHCLAPSVNLTTIHNNYAPPVNAPILVFNPTSSTTSITGLVPYGPGHTVTLLNTSSVYPFLVVSQSSLSITSYQFLTPSNTDIWVPPGHTLMVTYSAVLQRWVVTGCSSTGTGNTPSQSPQISIDQNNYPLPHTPSHLLDVTSASAMTGMTPTFPWQETQLTNVGNQPLTLVHESSSSSAGNRFDLFTDTDLVLLPGHSVGTQYNPDLQRWTLISSSSTPGPQTPAAPVIDLATLVNLNVQLSQSTSNQPVNPQGPNFQLTTLTPGYPGQTSSITNVNQQYTLVVVHDASTGPPPNRVDNPLRTDIYVPPGQTVDLIYRDDRWRPTGGSSLASGNPPPPSSIPLTDVITNNLPIPTSALYQQLNPGQTSTLTGAIPNYPGQSVNWVNVGSFPITFEQNSSSSSGGNRFETHNQLNAVLNPGHTLQTWYDSTNNYWVVTGGTAPISTQNGGTQTGSTTWTDTSTNTYNPGSSSTQGGNTTWTDTSTNVHNPGSSSTQGGNTTWTDTSTNTYQSGSQVTHQQGSSTTQGGNTTWTDTSTNTYQQGSQTVHQQGSSSTQGGNTVWTSTSTNVYQVGSSSTQGGNTTWTDTSLNTYQQGSQTTYQDGSTTSQHGDTTYGPTSNTVWQPLSQIVFDGPDVTLTDQTWTVPDDEEWEITGPGGLLLDVATKFTQPVTSTHPFPVLVRLNGGDIGVRSAINLIEGPGITIAATDDSGGGEVEITLGADDPGYYTEIQDEGGSPLPQRGAINFVGVGLAATDDSGNDRTNVTLTTSPGGIPVGVDRIISAGTGLTGGGNLSADRTLSVDFGSTAGTAAQGNDSRITGALQAANNLSEVASAATTRSNIGLGNSAVLDVGTSSGTVAAGNDSRIVNAVQTSRQIINGTGITGGGTLAADRTLSVVDDTTVQRVNVTKNSGSTVGSRPQLNFIEGTNITLTIADDGTDNEVDITIASSAGAGGYVTIQDEGSGLTQRTILNFIGPGLTASDNSANSRTNVTLATSPGGVPVGVDRSVSAGTGLSGGGDLSADVTLDVSYGTTAGTAAQGNDSRIVNAVPNSRTVTAGTGLSGGGALSSNISLDVDYGTSAGTAAEGNDSRITGALQAASNLSDLANASTSRTNLGLGGAAVLNVGTAAGTVAAGDDSRIVNALQNSVQVIAGTGISGGGSLSGDVTLDVDYGTTAGTAAQGNDSRIVNAVPNSRTVTAGTGLSGGGSLSGDITIDWEGTSGFSGDVDFASDVSCDGSGNLTVTMGTMTFSDGLLVSVS